MLSRRMQMELVRTLIVVQEILYVRRLRGVYLHVCISTDMRSLAGTGQYRSFDEVCSEPLVGIEIVLQRPGCAQIAEARQNVPVRRQSSGLPRACVCLCYALPNETG